MIESVQAVQALSSLDPQSIFNSTAASSGPKSVGFAELMANGIEATNTKLVNADKAIAAFAIDDSVPAHRVTYALEEARLSLELMLQVRNRLVEGYQQIMNMQV
jgi:flagellar hook-basal body complex protein FliE